jgi:hypothetical protein
VQPPQNGRQPRAREKSADRLRASLHDARVFGLSFPVVRQVAKVELERLALALQLELELEIASSWHAGGT